MDDFERVQRDYGLDDDEISALFPEYWAEHKFPHLFSKNNNGDYSDEDRRNANNCTPSIRNGMSQEERVKAASNLGENWANIMSGFGDQ